MQRIHTRDDDGVHRFVLQHLREAVGRVDGHARLVEGLEMGVVVLGADGVWLAEGDDLGAGPLCDAVDEHEAPGAGADYCDAPDGT